MNKSENKMYCQCLLKRKLENCSIIDVSWIPVEYAVIGKVLKLLKEDNSWENGWVVIKVYGMRNEEDILRMNWDYRKFGEVLVE